MQKYVPKPIDTSMINLSENIILLTELLAKNIHDNWALQRIYDGWTYGSVRDDKKKHHPCLIEYSDLPEQEKEYDRKTAVETIKLLISLGYEIRKK